MRVALIGFSRFSASASAHPWQSRDDVRRTTKRSIHDGQSRTTTESSCRKSYYQRAHPHSPSTPVVAGSFSTWSRSILLNFIGRGPRSNRTALRTRSSAITAVRCHRTRRTRRIAGGRVRWVLCKLHTQGLPPATVLACRKLDTPSAVRTSRLASGTIRACRCVRGVGTLRHQRVQSWPPGARVPHGLAGDVHSTASLRYALGRTRRHAHRVVKPARASAVVHHLELLR